MEIGTRTQSNAASVSHAMTPKIRCALTDHGDQKASASTCKDHYTAWIRMCALCIRVEARPPGARANNGGLAPRQANLKSRRTRRRVGFHFAAVCRHDLLHDVQS